MQQKVIQIGNSLGVTIPREFVKANRLRPGQKIFVESDNDLDLIQVRLKDHVSSLTPEFKEWLDKVAKKYTGVIQELAKR